MSRLKPKAKMYIWHRDRMICQYCGIKLTENTKTVDHKIPSFLGGTNDYSNLVACCRDCNQRKDKKERIRFYKSCG